MIFVVYIYAAYIFIATLICVINNYSTAYLSHKFLQINNDSELPNRRFHDLGHSTASYLLKVGVSMKKISDWLGHRKF